MKSSAMFTPGFLIVNSLLLGSYLNSNTWVALPEIENKAQWCFTTTHAYLDTPPTLTCWKGHTIGLCGKSHHHNSLQPRFSGKLAPLVTTATKIARSVHYDVPTARLHNHYNFWCSHGYKDWPNIHTLPTPTKNAQSTLYSYNDCPVTQNDVTHISDNHTHLLESWLSEYVMLRRT